MPVTDGIPVFLHFIVFDKATRQRAATAANLLNDPLDYHRLEGFAAVSGILSQILFDEGLKTLITRRLTN